MDDDYWRSRAGLEHRYRDRRLRIGRISLNQEPTAKGPNTDVQSAVFRHNASQQLVELRQPARPRAPFAIDLELFTTRPQPPTIEKLTKFYLDLLGNSDVPPRGPLIYRDDRQVRMLYARSRPVTHGRSDPTLGRVYVTAQARSDAVSTLEFAHELADADDNIALGEAGDRSIDAAIARRSHYELFPVNATEGDEDQWWRKNERDSRQAELLVSNGGAARDILFSFGRELVTGVGLLDRLIARYGLGERIALPPELLRPSFAERGRELLDYMLHIPLPALPSARGEGKRFAAAIDASIAQWVAEARYLRPLTVFLEVNIFLVPPAGGVDLDNVAMRVLPALRRHIHTMQPESDPIRSYMADELARLEQDPPDGMVTVILGADTLRSSPWEEALQAADRWFDAR